MKFFKYFGIGAIMIFSFYYTDRIANFVLEKNELYQKIKEVKDEYAVLSIDSVIDNNYIVPGLMGQEVNVKDSYYNMKSLNIFNEYYLVYDEVTPKVTLENNKDKIINKGNPLKESISFIIENDPNLINYFYTLQIPVDILVDMDSYSELTNYNLELINNEEKNYEKIESLLNNSNLNKNLCLVNDDIISICREKEKYLIEALTINNSNFLEQKENINSGNIYLIKKGTNLENLKLFIKDIKFKDLKIVYLSELISESK